MRWPDLFFKSRKPKPAPVSAKGPSAPLINSSAPPKESKEPSPAETAENRTRSQSLRALNQTDTVRLVPGQKPPVAPATVPLSPATTTPGPTSAPELSPTPSSTHRRLTKLTDVARILPKTDENTALSTTPSPDSPAVVPAAFPVAVEAGSVLERGPDKSAANEKTTVSALDPAPAEPATPSGSPAAPATTPLPSATTTSSAEDLRRALKETTRVVVAPPAAPPPEVSSRQIEPVKSETREKREFILANGERIYGHVLSETAEAIYLEHPTLGVLTLPRPQIAKRPIEVILINGDRVVGDLIAETTECLYIRHASLGMLTVPHGQRSTRVVEAILKDGDRILGEVLAETEQFTVIRSATLGTVAVQHDQVALLNRKVEQMQLRALPAPASSEPKRD